MPLTRRRFVALLRCAPAQLDARSEEHTSELQPQSNLVCRLLLEKKKKILNPKITHLNSSHSQISYTRFFLKKNNTRVTVYVTLSATHATDNIAARHHTRHRDVRSVP